MSNLGLTILYDVLNALPDVLAERAYLPWVDMIAALRQAHIPLYGLESKHPLTDFDIIASGHATFNPEPVADFVDAFVIGDGEEAIVEVMRAYQERRGESREAQLRELARIPDVYVPRFYDVCYNADPLTGSRHSGTIVAIEPNTPEACLPVLKRVVSVLPPLPTRLIIPSIDVAHNRATVEIQRGCARGCRFCHAGMVTRPVRELLA